MLEDNRRVLAHGTPGPLHIVLHPRAYNTLAKVSRARMPAQTFAALVGTLERTGEGTARITVVEGVPLESLLTAAGKNVWDTLGSRLSEDGRRIVGWFYADPGIGAAPPHLSLADIHERLQPLAEVLLLSNPASQSGGFYFRQAGEFVSSGGFYEELPSDGAKSQVPWSGTVRGALSWLRGTSEPVDGDSEQEIELPAFVQPMPAALAYGTPAAPVRRAAPEADGPLTATGTGVQGPPEEVPLRVRQALKSAQAAISAIEASSAREEQAEKSEAAKPVLAPDPKVEENVEAVEPASPSAEFPVGRTNFGSSRLAPVEPVETAVATAPPEKATVTAVEVVPRRRNVAVYILGLVGILALIIIGLIGAGFFTGPRSEPPSLTPVDAPTLIGAVAATTKGSTATPLSAGTGNLAPTQTALSAAFTSTTTRLPSVTATLPPATPTLTQVAPSPSATASATAVPPTSSPTAIPTATQLPATPTRVPVATRPPTPRPYITYVVQTGDTLTGIAIRYGTTINAIVAANRLGSTIIYKGQVLVIPIRR